MNILYRQNPELWRIVRGNLKVDFLVHIYIFEKVTQIFLRCRTTMAVHSMGALSCSAVTQTDIQSQWRKFVEAFSVYVKVGEMSAYSTVLGHHCFASCHLPDLIFGTGKLFIQWGHWETWGFGCQPRCTLTWLWSDSVLSCKAQGVFIKQKPQFCSSFGKSFLVRKFYYFFNCS